MRRFLSAAAARARGLVQAAFAGRPWLLGSVLLTVAVLGWVAAGFAAWFTWDLTMNLPGAAALRDLGQMAQSTTIYDRERRPVFTIFKEQRIEVPLSSVSPRLVEAVLAIEDQRFREHRGIDIVRVGGAVLANLRSGRRAQGGSTITQQLARQSFLTPDKTFRRKLKEMLLAAQIEHAYTKDQILELYLNKVYFGDGYYGVEAAARGYFARHASDLTIDQAALLAGLIQSPSAYAPTGNPGRALARRAVVLQAMLDNRAITPEQREAARETPLTLNNGLQRDESFGLYFKEAVRRELVDRFGWERVSEGGLRVHTTIDSRMQEEAERVIEAAVQRLERHPRFPHPPRSASPADGDATYLQAAALVLEAATSEVRVLVGGRDFKASRFNRVLQARRQPGSAFKPVLYAAAIENGWSPSQLLTNLNDPTVVPGGQWIPEDEHSGAGAMSVRSALRSSSNRAAARMIRELGLPKTLEMVERLQLGPLPEVPSIALGSGEVTLASLTAAFGAIAHQGLVRRPTLITVVEDSDGQVLFRDDTQPRRAMSEQTAFLMASMLQDVINAGTASRARSLGFTLPAAGKTGTTNDYMDAWFVGFTPSVVAGVWVGFDQPQSIMPDGYAGDVAVPVWADLMKVATAGHKAEWLPRPEGIVAQTVCRMSGKLAVEGCSAVEVTNDLGEVDVKSMAYTEYFRRGTAPQDTCPLHAQTAEVALEEAEAEAAEGERKRGFWKRLFGIGRDPAPEPPKKPEPPEPPQ